MDTKTRKTYSILSFWLWHGYNSHNARTVHSRINKINSKFYLMSWFSRLQVEHKVTMNDFVRRCYTGCYSNISKYKPEIYTVTKWLRQITKAPKWILLSDVIRSAEALISMQCSLVIQQFIQTLDISEIP